MNACHWCKFNGIPIQLSKWCGLLLILNANATKKTNQMGNFTFWTIKNNQVKYFENIAISATASNKSGFFIVFLRAQIVWITQPTLVKYTHKIIMVNTGMNHEAKELYYSRIWTKIGNETHSISQCIETVERETKRFFVIVVHLWLDLKRFG